MSATSPNDRDTAADIDDIYAALKAGGGRERVNDANVEALIQRAHDGGDAQLEFLLREWRSDCGADPDMPVLPAENPPPA